MRFPIIPLLLMALPIAEIAVFIIVGRYIGVLPVLGLIFLTAAAGSLLLRVQGLSVLKKLAAETDAGRLPARELVDGSMILLAGLFLLTPGFVTDLLGLLLFIPAVRQVAWSLISKHVSLRFVGSFHSNFSQGPNQTGAGHQGGRNGGQGPIVDLDEDDYQREADKTSPWNNRLEK
jgi:UPF0716 protein FxsA